MSVTIMRQLPHIKKNRHGVYYFRLIFTQSVRSISKAPQEISLSLETKDFVIAQERYMIVYPCARAFRWLLHESAMKGNIDVSDMKLQVKHWKEKNRLRELLAQKDEQQFEVQRELLKANNQNKELAEHAARMRDSNQRLKGALKSAKVMMSSSETSSTVPATFSKNAELEEASFFVSSPDAAERSSSTPAIKSTIATSRAKSPNRKRISKSETIFAYVEKFLTYEDAHSTHGKHTKEARRTNLMRFLDIVGYNVALKSLTAEHIRHYRDMMHAIPANFEKRGFSIPRARNARPKWFKDTISEWRGTTLSGSGIDTHFKHIRVFLTWVHSEHYLEHNFVSMLKVSKKRTKETKKEVVNFMPCDLNKLFVDGYLYGDTKQKRDNGVAWQFWVPLIALYTGMRSEEIGSLLLSDFVEVDGLWCIEVQKSKTEAGVRTFPIPQHLIDAGLLDYRADMLHESKEGLSTRLFPTLKQKGGEYSNRIGQFFNRNINGKLKDGSPRVEGYLYKCGVENPSDKQTLKFHSFRHGFITKWLEMRLPLSTLKNIVGHRGDFKTYGVVYEEHEGTTEAYIHSSRISKESRLLRLQEMKRSMDNMDFGVDLSNISYRRFLTRQ
ncbi:TPA: tyrosine-type recombinase/integrase [Vibrio vulnificus]|nr:tyrosine-type recombinase/integrase [Vibrio vulnificus]